MDNQEKITIVPLAISTEFWVSEIHAGFVLGYSGIRNKWLKLLIRTPFSYIRLVAISG